MSFREIAKESEVSEKTIRKRLIFLIENHVISIKAIVQPLAFGYVNYVNICFRVEKEFIKPIHDFCINQQCVSYYSKNWTKEHITLQCWFRTGKEMCDFISFLKTKEGVIDLNYHMVNEIIKDTSSWQPAEKNFG